MSSTVVIQSFRTHDVPSWIGQCLGTVASWADRSGFCYRFLGDEFLLLTPEWYREKAGKHITIVTDYARLELTRRLLKEGFDRCIWVDADVVILAPKLFSINLELDFGFSREVWFDIDYRGQTICYEEINNCVFVFRSTGIAQLERYIAECERTIRELEQPRDHLEVGPRLLTEWDRSERLPVIRNVGLLSPVLIRAILEDNVEHLRSFMHRHAEPLYALNLCNHFRTAGESKVKAIRDEVYSSVIGKLRENEGFVLNRFTSELFIPGRGDGQQGR
jgi:hypothetical protein